MPFTELFTEGAELLGVINPAASQAERNSGWVCMKNFRRAVIILHVGSIATSGTLDLDIEEAKDASGTGVQNISGKSITQLTDADDNKVVVVELRAEEMDTNDGYWYIQAELTGATADSISGLQIWGLSPRYKSVSTALIEEVVI